jgi:hypothetical protein
LPSSNPPDCKRYWGPHRGFRGPRSGATQVPVPGITDFAYIPIDCYISSCRVAAAGRRQPPRPGGPRIEACMAGTTACDVRALASRRDGARSGAPETSAGKERGEKHPHGRHPHTRAFDVSISWIISPRFGKHFHWIWGVRPRVDISGLDLTRSARPRALRARDAEGQHELYSVPVSQ